MLLFIYCGFVEGVVQQIFQNISCYCLSFIITNIPFSICSFQNISCYCLSTTKDVDIDTKGFQNISCYCLSISCKHTLLNPLQFQNISCYCLSKSKSNKKCSDCYFKTSHVIVYPWHFRVF